MFGHAAGVNLLDMLDQRAAEMPWLDSAACAGEPPELFVNLDLATDDLDRGLAVCGRCPVRSRCGAYATEHDETGAIWGGVLR